MSIRLPSTDPDRTVVTTPAHVSPQQALAAAIGGTVIGPNHIAVGDRLVTTRLASVLVDGVRVGQWNDPTGVLAAAVRAVSS